MRTINDIRTKFGNGNIFVDTFACDVANDYAAFLLEQPPNEQTFKQICESKLAIGEFQVLVGNAHLEEDTDTQDKHMMDEYMDAHGLLLELQHELSQLTAKDATHIGVGFAQNTHEVKVVELIC